MKKLLIATAAMAVVAGAQAQSSVTVYGIVDVSYGANQVKAGPSSASSIKTTGVADSANASSRIGFKGTEDLGGGLSAGFTLESGLNIVGGAATNKGNGETSAGVDDAGADSAVFGQATRQAFLTLGGAKTGTVLVGYKKQLESDFNDSFMIGTENSYGAEGQELQRIGRANQVAYTLPTLVNGLTLTAAHSVAIKYAEASGTNATDGIDAAITSLNATYTAGPLTVGAHFGKGDINYGSAAATVLSVINSSAPTALAQGNNIYDTQGIGASYDFGVVKVAAMAGQRKVGIEANSAFREVAYTNVGVAMPLGRTTLKASLSNNTADNYSGVEQEKNKGYQFQADYALSKRTTAWALYGSNTKKVSGSVDVDSTAVRAGLTHSF
jgi:predicted porin